MIYIILLMIIYTYKYLESWNKPHNWPGSIPIKKEEYNFLRKQVQL